MYSGLSKIRDLPLFRKPTVKSFKRSLALGGSLLPSIPSPEGSQKGQTSPFGDISPAVCFELQKTFGQLRFRRDTQAVHINAVQTPPVISALAPLLKVRGTRERN